MHTPVFLDHLPDIEVVAGQKPAEYRLRRNQALGALMLDASCSWTERKACPACGQSSDKNPIFSQALMEFRRCASCNSIYAARSPQQATLDRLRLDQIALTEAQGDRGDREFEFTSLLNWISLTEARLVRKLDRVMDIRFASQALAWPEATDRLSHNRAWEFLLLEPDSNDFAGLRAAITRAAPTAILMPAELDRVANPEALLVALKEVLPSGTVIFVASSCADGLEYEILGADSPSFVPLDRLTMFSVKGFEDLTTRLGLRVIEVSTPGRLDAVILDRYFKSAETSTIPFWSSFFREADKNRLRDLQILLQRSLKSGVMRFVLET
ncbi:hypothetical protein PXK00_16770 [Phaeobacter sp. QD34_3]|uniref:hypothetical protein n=1 Tax=unclassified Phaeobacter TaxID=2621772 RepID=UPI00237F2E91|nr:MULTISPECIES: hypothetical protein [unclassified Phaeobacter]MDE4134773.1 hypothetical protein [Phaeobacter sp. QD34_3]MDE4138431.1 hypothetical protein [Phaeobacter sp. QD34_24]